MRQFRLQAKSEAYVSDFGLGFMLDFGVGFLEFRPVLCYRPGDSSCREFLSDLEMGIWR